jgi:hypothetical protein
MIALTDEVLARIREHVLVMGTITVEVSHWSVIDSRGRYLESYGKTDFHARHTSFTLADLIQTACEANGGACEGTGIVCLHNHPLHPPDAPLAPSAPDVRVLEALARRLRTYAMELVDFGIVAPDNPGWSWRESVDRGEFPWLKASVLAEEYRRQRCLKR